MFALLALFLQTRDERKGSIVGADSEQPSSLEKDSVADDDTISKTDSDGPENKVNTVPASEVKR